MAARAEFGDDVAVLVQVHVRRGGQGRFFTEVQESLAAIGHLQGHETATTEVARRRVDHRQGIPHRNRRIHRIATALEHIDANVGRQVLGGHHHAVLRGNRGLGRSVGSQTAEGE